MSKTTFFEKRKTAFFNFKLIGLLQGFNNYLRLGLN